MIKLFFDEGRECFRNDVPVSANPYEGEAARSWEAGWDHEWFQSLRAVSERAPRY